MPSHPKIGLNVQFWTFWISFRVLNCPKIEIYVDNLKCTSPFSISRMFETQIERGLENVIQSRVTVTS